MVLDKYKSFLFFIFTFCNVIFLSAQATVSGAMLQYHKVTLTFDSFNDYSEENSTYENIRMDVTITTPSSKTYVVPGYFAADGNAAETSATAGNKWRIHFNPDEVGTYSYEASFIMGDNAVITGTGTRAEFDGQRGNFTINPTNKSGDDFRAKGKLAYVGEYASQFANGDYYFEVGADSPETFLEYADFDATSANNTYAAVANNYASGNPSWKGGRGTEIIGAVNYLASQGMNIHYFLTNNITGDGNRAYPFPTADSFKVYDVSKLSQWGIVFDHMYNRGIALEIVLLETENLNWFEDQEGISRQSFSDSRKIYYRELIARFGYLNVIWNIGEEANWSSGGDQYTPNQIEQAAQYIEIVSPYDDLITVHNGPSSDFTLFPQLTALSGTSALTAISFQGNFNNENHGNTELATVRELGNLDGKKWVVRYSEPFSGNANPNIETWTNDALWAGICGGAKGVHYYAGGGRDITGDNYINYAPYYRRMRFAKEFFEDNQIPFWDMAANNDAISNGYLLSKPNEYHVVFLDNGGSARIDFSGSGDYDVKWFDPRNGGNLLNGSVSSVPSGNNVSIGNPPNSNSQSWVVFLEKNGNDSGVNQGNDNECEADYAEVNNIVVIEAEDLDTNNEWSVENESAGFSGSGYLEWGKASHFNSPGNGLISVKIQINDPGRYRFQWRSRIGEGTSTTDENDSWLRFPDADDFYGQRGSSIVYPRGSGKSPNPNGSSSNGWFKVYTNTIDWNWTANTSDNDPHQIYVEFDDPGIYTMEISARSTYHFLDRIVLSKSFDNPTDLSLELTVCDGSQSAADIPVNSVEITPETNLMVGETSQLDYTVLPSNATNKSVTWLSNDTEIVSVDTNGNITGVSEGTATVQITTVDGNFTDTVTVIVETPIINVSGIDASPNNSNLILGQTVQLNATVVPNNATNKGVSWTSNNTSLATVDSNGLVTTIGLGSVTITAESDEGGFMDSVRVNINEENNDIAVESVTINPKEATIKVGEIQEFNFLVLPEDATDKSVSWSSSDNTIATVNANGLVSGIAEGSAVIRILTLDGNFIDTATVTIEPQEDDIAVTGVTTDAPTEIEVGNNRLIRATVFPTNATNKRVVWSSSDEEIATVNSNGFVVTLNAGVVIITATTVDGGFVANNEITIVPQNQPSVVTGFVLVNSTIGEDIMPLNNGSIVDGNMIDLENLNIKVNTSNTIGSLRIELSGPINLNRTENVVPYSVFGNIGFGTYNSENLLPGNYILSATAFSERNLNGNQIGNSNTVSFEVVENTTISVESISVDPDSSTMEIGQTLQMSATINPTNATNKEVLWISSDEEIASVDSGGLVRAIAEGEVEIIGQSSDGSFTASSTITVIPLPVILPQVSLSTENSANEGNTVSITVSLDRTSQERISFTINYIDITTNQSDYNSILESVTFLPGETEKTISIATVNDTSEEEDEVFQVQLIPENEELIQNTDDIVTEVSIIDNDNQDDIKLFPNPSVSSSNITLSGIQIGIYQITIFSISGNLISSNVVDIDSDAYEFTLPSTISEGLYMLRMQSVDNNYLTKIMVR